MRHALSGITVAKGLALGRARIREPQRVDIEERHLAPDEVDAEIERLHQAIASTRQSLQQLRDQLHGALTTELGEFLDIHALLLDDPELLASVTGMIRDERYSAAYALKLQRDRLAAIFQAMDDPYLRARREDIEHLIGRVQAALQPGPHDSAVIGLAGDVLISDTVAPAELAQLAERGVVAVLVSQGSPLSHSAILARSLGLPMLIVAPEALAGIHEGAAVMVDAQHGQIIVEPGPDDLLELREREFSLAREQRAHARRRNIPARTRDGVEILLRANAESREDVARAHELCASGIGLYRTEFLFLQRHDAPDEEEQLIAYRDAVLGMNGRPVTLRVLDLGADKADSAGITLAREPNPALGLRGVRLALARPELFRTQLRAMLRASGYGPVRILVPMVTRRREMLAVRELLAECRRELLDEGHHLAQDVPLGAMIEVPAAALGLSAMIDAMDFISIGTNDLVQYLLAADRDNDSLGDLFSPLYPAVIQVLDRIISSARRAAVPASICGEIASDPHHIRMLLALGLTDFSMHPTSLAEIHADIGRCDLASLRRRRNALLRAPDRAHLEALVRKL